MGLEKEADRRYPSMRAFADDLREVRESRPIAAVSPSVATRFVRWLKREPIKASLAFGLGALLLVSAGLGGFLFARQDALTEGAREIERQRVIEMVVDLYLSAPAGRLSDEQMTDVLIDNPKAAVARVLQALSAVARGESELALATLDAAPEAETEGGARVRSPECEP